MVTFKLLIRVDQGVLPNWREAPDQEAESFRPSGLVKADARRRKGPKMEDLLFAVESSKPSSTVEEDEWLPFWFSTLPPFLIELDTTSFEADFSNDAGIETRLDIVNLWFWPKVELRKVLRG